MPRYGQVVLPFHAKDTPLVLFLSLVQKVRQILAHGWVRFFWN